MKNLFLFFFLASLIYPTVTTAQWVQIPITSNPGSVNSLSSDGSNIVAASWGVALSTDNGSSWRTTSFGDHQTGAILISGNNIFAGTSETPPMGIYKSSDLGNSWSQTVINNSIINVLAKNSTTIFAGTNTGEIYKSTDNGVSWSAAAFINFTPEIIFSLAVTGNTVYAGVRFGGVLVSTDNGDTFTQTSLMNNLDVESIGIIGSNIFAATNFAGVYLSTNNGATWSQTALNNVSVQSLLVNGTKIFAGLYNGGLRYSTNNGASWLQTEIINDFVYSLTSTSNTILTGTFSGALISTNGGMNWNQSTLNFNTISAVAAKDNYIFASKGGAGIFLSSDNGASWVERFGPAAFGLAASSNRIFACAYNGVFASSNNGLTWTQPGASAIGRSITVNDNFAFTGYDGIFKGDFPGQHWGRTAYSGPLVFSLAGEGSNVYAGTLNGGVYKSSNDGISWEQTSLTDKTVKSLAANGNNVFAGTLNFGVYLSTNGGISWSQTSLNNQSIYSLAVRGQYIFAGSKSQNNFYVSSDNGNSWTLLNGGIESATINSICLTDNYAIAGTTESNILKLPLGLVGIHSGISEEPKNYSLLQNYPNPFNPSTIINYQLSISSFVSLKVFDMTGREVSTLVNGNQQAGTYSVSFDALNLSSGIYFYKIAAGEFVDTKRMVLIK